METQGQNWDDLLKKIDALQALCAPDSGATQHEIEAATGRMQALLTRHALTMEMVQPHLGTVDKSAMGAFDVKTTSATWRTMLLGAVARNNFGQVIYLGGGMCQVISDRTGHRVIIDLYGFLSDVIEKLALIEWDRVSRDDYRARYAGKRAWVNSFRLGAVSGVNEAMKAARKTTAAEFDGGSALVLVKDEKVNAKFRELYPRTTTRSSRYSNASAYSSGREAGRGIALGGQIGGGSTKAIA